MPESAVTQTKAQQDAARDAEFRTYVARLNDVQLAVLYGMTAEKLRVAHERWIAASGNRRAAELYNIVPLTGEHAILVAAMHVRGYPICEECYLVAGNHYLDCPVRANPGHDAHDAPADDAEVLA